MRHWPTSSKNTHPFTVDAAEICAHKRIILAHVVCLSSRRRDGVHVMYGITGRLPSSADGRVTEGGVNTDKGKSGSVAVDTGVPAMDEKDGGGDTVHVAGDVGSISEVVEGRGGGGLGGGVHNVGKSGLGGHALTDEGGAKEGSLQQDEAHNVLNNVVGDSSGEGAAGKEAGGGVDEEAAAIDAGYVAPVNVVIASMTHRGENQAIRELMKVEAKP